MGIIESDSNVVKDLQGLHLYHAGRSNCSARARLVLEEKGLKWTSHHVDIYNRANVTTEYFSINPKGLVPTLVHDGKVIVESNDILLYVEETFPEPGFTPAMGEDREKMKSWLQRSGNIHMPGIKTYAYVRRHAADVVKTPEEIALYRSLQKDPALLEFHGKHDLPGEGFTDQDINNAENLINGALGEMDRILSRADWMTGDAYSLADISWAPSITTLQGVGFPVEDYPRVMEWYERVSARPAFKRAVSAWRETTLEGVVDITPGVDIKAIKQEIDRRA